jgi:hypothetical protein
LHVLHSVRPHHQGSLARVFPHRTIVPAGFFWEPASGFKETS